MRFMIGMLFLFGTVMAQQPLPEPKPSAPSQERIYFSVLDRSEKPVLGLAEADFALRLNGRPAQMGDFQAGRPSDDRSVPLVAWILLDFNPNINAAMIVNQAGSASGFMQQLHSDSALGVKLVSNRSETLAPLAHDPAAVSQAFQQFRLRRNQLQIKVAEDSALLGSGGILRAAELAMEELDDYVLSQPGRQGGKVRKAIVILSDANVNPSYNRRGLLETAVRRAVFFYPIFIPRQSFGYWVEQYFNLAKETGAVALSFGAMNPGSNVFRLPRDNRDPNALTFNFLSILRDLNGKYSFLAPIVPDGSSIKIDLRCLKKDVSIRLPRKSLP